MKRFLSIIVALAFYAVSSMAESSLTIDQAAAMAKEKNLGLLRIRVNLEAADRAVKNSWNSYLPNISAGLGGSGNFYSSTGWSANASLTASLTVSPSVLEDARQIRLLYDSGTITLRKAERSLELSVRKAFYALLLAEERVRLAAQKVERSKQSLATAKQRYDAGLVPELDVLTALVSLESLKPSLLSVETSRDTSYDSLKLLLGMDLGEALKLQGNLEDEVKGMSGDTMSARTVEAVGKDTLDIQALSNSLQTAQSSLKAKELASMIPSGTVSLSTRPTFSVPASSTSKFFADNGSVSLSFSLNLAGLIPGSSVQAAIETARDSVIKIESQLAEQRLAVASSAKSYLRSIRTALSSLEAYGGTIALAQKTYDLTNEAYQRGLKTLNDMENASASLDETRVGFLGQAYTLLAAVLDLENILDLEFGTIAR
jgi:outer membrane protein